ncbi:MAG: GTPase HflX [Solobacterium sp.]|nr:GTPase HflX [Solobacterium sp.]
MEENRKVVLAYFYTYEEKETVAQVEDECIALCASCGMRVVAKTSQQVSTTSGFGKGKLEALKHTVETMEADAIVFANNLSIASAQRIGRLTGVEVMDRTSLILHIFSLRARTKEAVLQVEMARLQYDMPRLSLMKEQESHTRGGSFTNRGAGEMRSSILKRKYQNRIKQLKKEIQALEKEQNSAERRRTKTSFARVALVGYTNAGKSSLMNAILQEYGNSKKEVYVEDRLFATLDTSVRNIRYQTKEFLLYDTVGFVSSLPHELIEAFHSTLASARNADLLVHVIDATDPNYADKITITQDALTAIHAEEIPILRVFNKIDLVENKEAIPGLKVSALTKEGLPTLLQEILKRVYPEEISFVCLLPYAKIKLYHDAKKYMTFEILEEKEDGLLLKVSGPENRTRPFKIYQVE